MPELASVRDVACGRQGPTKQTKPVYGDAVALWVSSTELTRVSKVQSSEVLYDCTEHLEALY